MKKIVHIFGMTNTGKTTIAKAIVTRLGGASVEHIDADEHRKMTCKDLGFSKEDRLENLRRLYELADKSSAETVILTAVTPFDESRRADSIKVYLTAPGDVLRKRDDKGIYQMSDGIAGVHFPFEEPTDDGLRLDTSKESVSDCAELIIMHAGLKPVFSMFVGRWQTLHAGHDWLFEQQLKNGNNALACIRDVQTGPNNPLTANEVLDNMRKRYAKLIEDGRMVLMVIPDISSINYGRDVGYEVIKHDPPTEIGEISGTSIRQSKN